MTYTDVSLLIFSCCALVCTIVVVIRSHSLRRGGFRRRPENRVIDRLEAIGEELRETNHLTRVRDKTIEDIMTLVIPQIKKAFNKEGIDIEEEEEPEPSIGLFAKPFARKQQKKSSDMDVLNSCLSELVTLRTRSIEVDKLLMQIAQDIPDLQQSVTAIIKELTAIDPTWKVDA